MGVFARLMASTQPKPLAAGLLPGVAGREACREAGTHLHPIVESAVFAHRCLICLCRVLVLALMFSISLLLQLLVSNGHSCDRGGLMAFKGTRLGFCMWHCVFVQQMS